MRSYKIIVGVPTLRVLDDGTVIGRTGKPIRFTGYGETSTFVIDGRVRRVKRDDILRCAESGENLAVALNAKRRNATYKGVNRSVMARYNELANNISKFVCAIMNGDKNAVVKHLYERIPNYVKHFAYLNISPADLYDIIADCCIELAEDIVSGKRVVVAPDNYIIKMAKCKLSSLYEKL